MKPLKIIIENDSDKRIDLFFSSERGKDLSQYISHKFQVENDFNPLDHTYIINDKYYSPCSRDIEKTF